MARRKTVKLFRYSKPSRGARTLSALKRAYPENQFLFVQESLGWGFNILAIKPDGTQGRVARAPLATFGKGV